MNSKTVSSHYLIVLLNSLNRHGVQTTELMEKLQLTSAQIHSNNERVPYQTLTSLCRFTWLELQDETFGLSVKPMALGGFSYGSRLAISADNIGHALDLLFGYYNYIDSGIKVKSQVINDEFEFQIIVDSPDRASYHMLVDFVLAGFHRFCCWLSGKQIILKRVAFDFPPPEYVTEYGLLYSCPTQFDSDKVSMTFSSNFLKLPIVKTFKELDDFIETVPEGILLNPVDDQSYTIQVKRFVEAYKGKEFPKFDNVAAHLNMVPKTLRLHLKSEGISYQKIKDVVRKDWAIYYLSLPHYSIASIAEKIGFTETCAFIRAFKGWTDTTPSVYRSKIINIK